MTPLVDNLLVIGLGMIGGSLAKALKQRGFARSVIGSDRNEDELTKGVSLGVIDEAGFDLAAAVAKSDLIVLAVPVKATETVLRAIQPYLKAEVVLTDVGSTKRNVIEAAQAVFGRVPEWFVPGHPIAGSEKSGVAAADADLFKKHKVIVAPLDDTSKEAQQLVSRMWQVTGAELIQMDIHRHDEVLAATSHLPHVLAFSLVDTLAKEQDNLEIFRYAAGGFRDFTRIAASDPTMWRDVCDANQAELLAQIDKFTAGLSTLRQAIVENDGQQMLGIFTRAKAAREHFTKMLAGTAYSQKHNNVDVTFHAHSGGAINGQVVVPGDKSISHRAIIFGALAEGETIIDGFLECEDSLATLQAFRDMGVVIEGPYQGRVKIYGVGLHGLCEPPGPLYLGNSATAMRLMAGLLAAQPFDTVLQGDASLSSRPMEQVVEPLRRMGATISTTDGHAPLLIKGGPIKSQEGTLVAANSQIKTALMLAALYAQDAIEIAEPSLTRDHTERMLRQFGANVTVRDGSVAFEGAQRLCGTHLQIPADLSSAALFILAALITEQSDLLITRVGINPGRKTVLDVLCRMGGAITLSQEHDLDGEPVADIHVRSSELVGTSVDASEMLHAIDDFPVICVAAALASGETVIARVPELEHKESNQVEVITQALLSMGASISVEPTEIRIRGKALLNGAELTSGDDHRIAMALAVAAARAEGDVVIKGCANVATSFPDFAEVASKAGLKIHKEETDVSK